MSDRGQVGVCPTVCYAGERASFDLSFSARKCALLQDKDSATVIGKYHGVRGLSNVLGSDPKRGLDDATIEANRAKYGANRYKQVPPKSFFSILFEGFKDPVILLLCAAATVSMVV
eukprot:GHRR01001928.1.p1 GENE.GHRR01001928.1~~GHRR01001928.1.p1  ORF type:complete len:116 (+),score=5.07 GHRR01001928.1:378-725(+)